MVWGVGGISGRWLDDDCGSVAEKPVNGRCPTHSSTGLDESRTGLQSRSSAECGRQGLSQAPRMTRAATVSGAAHRNVSCCPMARDRIRRREIQGSGDGQPSRRMNRVGGGLLRQASETWQRRIRAADRSGARIRDRVLIILREPFADFGGGCADHRIEIRVVVRIAPEYLDAQGPFLEFPRMAIQRAFDDIAQEVGISLAVLEERSWRESAPVGPGPRHVRLRFRTRGPQYTPQRAPRS